MKQSLDKTDYQIIHALQQNARQSNKDLAQKVGLAPSSCLNRVRRLKETNVLLGFHADVDPAALGIGLQALVSVQLQQQSAETVAAFKAELLEMNEVVSVYHLAGPDDFLIHIAAKDPTHLQQLTLHIASDRSYVGRVQTSVIYELSQTWTLPVLEEEA